MKQIVIDVNELEVKVGFLEDGKLTEFFMQKDDHSRINGNIYKGKVENILPGMESAFVNIGLSRNSFLYVNDLREFEEKFLDGIKNSDKPIEDILKVGDEVVVQILKEPRGTKGARVTTHYTIPGKYLVLMPNNDYIGISKKIKDEEERERLENILRDIKPSEIGVVIRTDAQGKNEVHFEREMEYLVKKWQEIEGGMSSAKIGDILYEDNNLIKRVVRDIFSNDVDELVINHEKSYWELIDYVSAFSDNSLNTKIKLYSREEDIFEYYSINKELKKALNAKVPLDCGGSLVIERTEALVSIDVNTGKNIGVHNLEETVLETNLEAAREIPRQLRLRNLSGIIIIDFIDMRIEEDKIKVLNELEKNLAKDRIKNNIVHFTDLGLVEMTRKRVGKPLFTYFLTECQECGGTGYIKGNSTLLSEIFEELKCVCSDKEVKFIKIKVAKDLYTYIMDTYYEFIRAFVESKEKKVKIIKEDTRKNKDYELILEI
jgi:ribonuclease G